MFGFRFFVFGFLFVVFAFHPVVLTPHGHWLSGLFTALYHSFYFTFYLAVSVDKYFYADAQALYTPTCRDLVAELE